MLSILTTRICGKPASSLLRKFIFHPMGSEFPALAMKDPRGINELGGGLAVTTRDLAKFGLVLLHEGSINNKIILPKSYISHLYNTLEPNKWQAGWISQLTPQAKAYRSQLYFAADEFDAGAFFAVGNYGQALYINPKKESIIALTSSYPQGVDLKRFSIKMKMLRVIANNI